VLRGRYVGEPMPTKARKPQTSPTPPPSIILQAQRQPFLPVRLLEKVLSRAMSRGGDFAEVYVERAVSTAVILEERRIKSAQTGLSQGIGVRVIAGGKVGYAYSDDLDDAALVRAADTAALISESGG